MDYKSFISRDDAFQAFVKYRREVLDSGEDGDFSDAFVDLCTKAMSGDAVAQDCVAYFFNKGFPDILKQNYEYYMSWQILAGANGNEFALEKLEFFLKPAMDAIFDNDDILKEAMRRGNITKDNALSMISSLLCEGIVDELKINPKKLIEINDNASGYSPEKNRIFVSALENALPKVIDFLVS